MRQKALDQVEKHGRGFIALSPFCVISAADADGRMDVSPCGGEPGFVHVSEDGRTLFVPDRPGNNRLDILRSFLTGDGHIGLMFLIPGFDDVLRVNGSATLTNEPDLLEAFVEFGKLPRLIIRVTGEDVFLRCPKAIMRGRLWDPEARIDRAALPSGAQMILDQLQFGALPVSDDSMIADYKTQL